MSRGCYNNKRIQNGKKGRGRETKCHDAVKSSATVITMKPCAPTHPKPGLPFPAQQHPKPGLPFPAQQHPKPDLPFLAKHRKYTQQNCFFSSAFFRANRVGLRWFWFDAARPADGVLRAEDYTRRKPDLLKENVTNPCVFLHKKYRVPNDFSA